jgi:hypothetical protein
MAGHWAGMGVVAAWTVACFLLAVRRFKWA